MSRRAAALALLAGLAGLSCSGSQLSQARPLASTVEVAVTRVEPVGGYLEAHLVGPHLDLQLLFPAQACAGIVVPEARGSYLKRGVFGRFRVGDAHCDALGVASLAAWRDRRPRRRGPPLPRATARFTLVEWGERELLVRGRFPLVGEIGISSGYDLMALLPSTVTCETLVDQGEASLEYRGSGPDPFRLLMGREFCPVRGFAIPQ